MQRHDPRNALHTFAKFIAHQLGIKMTTYLSIPPRLVAHMNKWKSELRKAMFRAEIFLELHMVNAPKQQPEETLSWSVKIL